VITLGVDAHKQVHVAVALDAAGRERGRWRGPNSQRGWEELAQWAAEFGGPRQWGIEGAWNYGRGLAQHLVASAELVYEVNPRWTALGRRSARKAGKSDPLDAHAVALLVWREAGTLPRVAADDETAVLDLLVTERDGALAEATRLRNQIHALLLQLDPEYRSQLPNLQTRAGLAAVESYTASSCSRLAQERAAAVRRLAQRLRLALDQAEQLAKQIRTRAGQSFALLTRLCGINLLTAGALAGILGPGQRFATDAQLAAYAGVAPLEASSAGTVRHRLNRGGNRRLNAILYRIALTQARYSSEARTYLDRRVAEGKTRREALRALKRFLVRAIWRLWQECLAQPAGAPTAAVA
jgi:transposase